MSYKPKLTDIVLEMYTDLDKSITRAKTCVKQSDWKNNLLAAGTSFLGGAVCSYVICSIVYADEPAPKEYTPEYSSTEYDGIGIPFAVLGFASQLALHYYLYETYSSEMLFLPLVTTNIISGVYEWGYNANKRLINKNCTNKK